MRALSRRLAVAAASALSLLECCRPAAAQQQDPPSRPPVSIVKPVAAYVAEASERFSIPAAWIWAVMQVESGGEARVTSPAGAMGLMQVMPGTYTALGAKLGLGANPYDPHDNIMAGAAFLRDMHEHYGDAGFLAAYDAGPVRYEDFRAGGRPLPTETVLYLARLDPMLGLNDTTSLAINRPRAVANPKGAPIFVSLHGDVATADPHRSLSPTIQLAAAQLQTDDGKDGLFISRTLSSERSSAGDHHVPSAQTSSTASARPEQVGGQSDTLIVPRSSRREF